MNHSVLWEYFGGEDRFPPRFDEMMYYVDKCDSGRLTTEEIDNPKGWVLLSFMMDPRTGLGRYRDYRISNYQLMMELVEWCRTKTVEMILEMPDVEERIERYFEQDKLFREMIRQNTEVHGNLVAGEEIIAFNAGTHPDVVLMRFKDYQNLVKPEIVHFARTVTA